jgi:hypothetical protein
MCPLTIYVSSYYICVLLLYMCPLTIYVSSYYTCPLITCVLLLYMCPLTIYVSSYYICVRRYLLDNAEELVLWLGANAPRSFLQQVLRYVPIYTDMYRYTPICTDIHRYVSICQLTSTPLAPSSSRLYYIRVLLLCMCPLTIYVSSYYVCVLLHIWASPVVGCQRRSDMYRYTPICTDIHRYVSISQFTSTRATDMYRYTPIYTQVLDVGMVTAADLPSLQLEPRDNDLSRRVKKKKP